MLRSLVAFSAIAVLTAPAFADECGGSKVVDRCLVGTWEMTTNGMQEWTKKHLRNFHPATVKTSNNTITLNADGTFSTGASHAEAQGSLGSGATAKSTMDAQASGTWSAADGKFNLCARQSTMQSTTTVTVNGHTSTTPVQHAVPAVTTQSYTCAGQTFSTTTQLRGDDVVSIYTKQK
jgi:hypothetical protein